MSDERNYIQLSRGGAYSVSWTNMLTTYGLYVVDKDIFKIPERSYTLIDVPGSNGSYVVDDGYYKNIDIWYDLGYTGTTTTIPSLMDSLSAFFAGAYYSGKYFRVTDSYMPLYYRQAILKSEVNMLQELKSTGKMRLNLSCKPYRYYISGETGASLTVTPVEITNPSQETAYPVYVVIALPLSVGAAVTVTIKINTTEYDINIPENSSSYAFVLDCEKKVCYDTDGVVHNDWLDFTTFPTFPTGAVNVSAFPSVPCFGFSAEVRQRWYTL